MCQERQKNHPSFFTFPDVTSSSMPLLYPMFFLKEKPIFDQTKILSYVVQASRISESQGIRT